MNRGFLFLLVFGIIGGLIIIGMALMVYGDNIKNTESDLQEIHIPSNSDYQSVISLFEQKGIIKNMRSFEWVAARMNYPNTVESGKYVIPNFMSNRGLVLQLRNGFREQSLKLTLNSINSKDQLYAGINSVLEADTSSLKSIYESDSVMKAHNLTIDNGWATVLADTYQFHWDTDAQEFFDRMQTEFTNYWDETRTELAAKKNLSPIDCIVLASIIEKESIKTDEYHRIAGVYVNRVLKGWPLQADPTVKFALKQPELKRILKVHLEIDSPYNTYKYPGIPPGPIGLPEKTTIEAVLNSEEHDYMFFCAKDDFSGYHVFAKTNREHEKNSKKYHKALNKNGIY